MPRKSILFTQWLAIDHPCQWPSVSCLLCHQQRQHDHCPNGLHVCQCQRSSKPLQCVVSLQEERRRGGLSCNEQPGYHCIYGDLSQVQQHCGQWGHHSAWLHLMHVPSVQTRWQKKKRCWCVLQVWAQGWMIQSPQVLCLCLWIHWWAHLSRTSSKITLTALDVCDPGFSDHLATTVKLHLCKPPLFKKQVLTHNFKHLCSLAPALWPSPCMVMRHLACLHATWGDTVQWTNMHLPRPRPSPYSWMWSG